MTTTTTQYPEKVKLYFIEIRGPLPALMIKRYAESPGAYLLSTSLSYAIETGAYYKSKKGLMYDSGQYLLAAGTKFKIISFTVSKPFNYDLLDL